MSHHEAQKIRKKLAPFMSLLLVVACIGLLASCGGGGGQNGTIDTTKDWKSEVNTQYLDAASKQELQNGKTLDDIGGVLQDKYWVESYSLSQAELENIIRKYTKLKILKFDEYNGFYIEINPDDSESLVQIGQLEKEDGISSVYKETFTGKNVDRTFSAPIDGDGFTQNGKNWHHKFIRSDLAWDLTTGSTNVEIGIIDNGFYVDHPLINSRIDEQRVSENQSHGTAVASVIATQPDKISGIVGLNWVSKINIANYIDGHTSSTKRQYEKMLQGNNLIKVVSNSWGDVSQCSDGRCPTIDESIEKTRAYRNIAKKYPNVVHVWAAANDGKDAIYQNGAIQLNKDGSINKLDNIIIVGAILSDASIASYSNDGYLVDIYAPTEFAAAGKPGDNHFSPNGIYGDNYSGIYNADGSCAKCAFNGTSAATPVVSGVVSLMLSVNKDLTPKQIKELLIQSANTYPNTRRLRDGSLLTNSGTIKVVNAEKAVRAALDTLPAPTITNITASNGTPTTADAVTFTATASSDNGAITAWSWNFGDNTATSAEQSPTHTFTTAGTYTVTLTVTDAKGKQASRQKTITVSQGGQQQAGTWTGFDSETQKFTSSIVYQDNGFIRRSTQGSGALRFRFQNTFDGDNFRFSARMKNDPAFDSSAYRDMGIQLRNDFTTGSFDANGNEAPSRLVGFHTRNGYSTDYFYIGSSTGNRIEYTSGVLSNEAWHTYTINVKGGTISLYYDGVLKYTATYQGSFGTLDTLAVWGMLNVQIEPSSISLSAGQ